jgi:alpha-galactosidase
MRVLHSQHSSLVICERAPVPRIVYFGARLASSPNESELALLLEHAIPQGGIDEAPQITIAPSLADPIFMNPAIRVHSEGLLWAPQWHLFDSESSDAHVSYTLSDHKSGLILSWTLNLDVDTNVFTISTCLENKGAHTLSLEQWLTTVPIPSSALQAISFTGRWINEFQPQYHELKHGTLEWANLKGRTSHDHFPGLIVGDEYLSESSGEAVAFHLGWSGNHIQRLEKSQNGLAQYQAGIGFMPGEMILKPGDHFEAAPLYMTRTSNGLGGIAENFQPFVRQHILNFPDNKPRPVHINTWEALYFNHAQEELDSLAQTAAEVGAERYVLDDGWFLGRRDDTAGLGDWIVDPNVYPHGLHPLKDTLKKHGLGFGLWFEPEMINKKSKLYEQHPDWVLQLSDQHQASGRNQWVLDISRSDVQQYLVTHICDILRDYPVEYIKWDMNRDLLQAGNQSGQPAYYQYVVGLYAILKQVRSQYPHVEIESCASGGGRMDYGILKYTHRFWLSDCNDAHERQIMQQWASLFFPAEVLGSHIGPDHSHTTSRSHPLYVRAGTALFAHMGIEWDVRKANTAQRKELTMYLNQYKMLRELIHSGIRRPLTPADSAQIAFSVSDDTDQIISVFQRTVPKVSVPQPLKITALKPEKNYRIEILIQPFMTGHLMKQKPVWMKNQEQHYRGEILMALGLPLPVLDPESLIIFKVLEI